MIYGKKLVNCDTFDHAARTDLIEWSCTFAVCCGKSVTWAAIAQRR